MHRGAGLGDGGAAPASSWSLVEGEVGKRGHARLPGPRRAGGVPSCRPPACAHPLCVQELQELERKLEDALAHQKAAQLERALASRQQWAGDGPGLLNEAEDTDSERQVSAVLWRALSKSQTLLEHQQQR